MTELSLRQLVRESLPLPAILLLWSVLAAFVGAPIQSGLELVGVVMMTLYAVVRGVGLGRTRDVDDGETDLPDVLRQNGRVAVVAGVWFLAATLVSLLRVAWRAFVELPAFSTVAEPVVFVFVGSGVGTVVLYAVAVATAELRPATPSRSLSADD